MKLVGRVADGSTESSARLILMKDFEKKVAAEELVLIENAVEGKVCKILGVLREGLGKNEFLSASSYRPDVAYMKLGGEPSGAREVYSFAIKPIGVVTEEGLDQNRLIIQPRAPVYILEDEDNPMEWIVKGLDVLWTKAHIERHESWKVPVVKNFIPYHVGVYGTTGSGKSWFTRYILIPLYIAAGYRIIVLDWSGTDYTPYYKNSDDIEVIKITDIAMDEESVLSYFEDKTFDFAKNNNVKDAFDEFIEGWAGKVENAKEMAKGENRPETILYDMMRRHVENTVNTLDTRSRQPAIRAIRRVFRRLKAEDLAPLMGTLPVEEVYRRLSEKKMIVIDMSSALSEGKLGFFLSLSNYLYSLMEAGNNLNLSLVIDEAPQYAPWSPKGIQEASTEMIKNLAALGRKRMFNLTLISQGVKGDIGINASVRRNLTSNFFGRIHPLDASGEGGALEWLAPYGITADQLLQLKPGIFYFTGLMNPSPTPLLITYKVEAHV
ncbi:MAG: ATP-binding protein [Nitrososphaeria archaeon]